MAVRRSIAVLSVMALAAVAVLRMLFNSPERQKSLATFDRRPYRQLTDFHCTLSPSETVFRNVDPRSHPTVAIIGTAKGGTTDVFELLIQALDFIAPHKKEPGDMANDKMTGNNYIRLRYLRKLNHPCTKSNNITRQKHTCVASTDALTIDASMSYLERQHVPTPFQTISTGTKTIVMLREPVERASSLFNHWQFTTQLLKGRTLEECAQIFLAWAESIAGTQRLAALLSANDFDSMHKAFVDFRSFRHSTEVHIFYGFLYAYQLSNWLVHFFEPGNVLVLDSHLYYSLNRGDALTLLSQYVFGHGPTDEQIAAAYAIDIQNAKLHVGLKANTTYLEDSTVLRLRQIFAPFNRKLLDVVHCMRTGGHKVVGFDADPWISPTTLH